MKKNLSHIIAFCLIVTLSAASVLCCKMQAAQAESFSIVRMATPETMPACHKHKSDVPAKAKCDCCVTKLQADVLSKVSFLNPQIISGYLSSDVVYLSSAIFQAQFQLASSNSPPELTSETPLYIHFHTFRI